MRTTASTSYWKDQEQPHRGIPRKSYSENMQQVCRRTPMLKCDFIKVAQQRSCGAVVQWLSLLHNFFRLSLNLGSALVQSLLAACRRFTMVRISLTMVPAGNKANHFCSVNHTKKTIIISSSSSSSSLKSHFGMGVLL